MTAELRAATAADVAAMQAIAEAAYARYVPRLGRAPLAMHPDFEAALALGGAMVLEAEGACVGYSLRFPVEGAFLIDNLAVRPDRHGQGLGRRLLDEAEAAALAAGRDRIRLYTNVVMRENQALYVRLGYRETGRDIHKGMHRLHFEKALGAGG